MVVLVKVKYVDYDYTICMKSYEEEATDRRPLNLLFPGRYDCESKYAALKQNFAIDRVNIQMDIILEWILEDRVYIKSTLF